MAEHENPFRPEEVLYHEVDPIVEQYMQKPFPPSRPGSAENTPVKQQKDGAAAGDFVDDLPPAGKVELVHVKKRKCGCCTVQ
ncbi:hypothetical protein TELCIR_01102 [Teladorsagia circumcincta]|uniref:Uncharacterized protein n=1 Tax=Teladorsagia circumcincta TaxID=45464 RepID=A0A2G9V2S9_TELCI|nr:hypothetical protein TELCIR_01102 [Teladorsagia circumcincta]